MLNNVVLSVIACLENEVVMSEIQKQFVVKVTELEKYKSYVNSEEIKDKKITKDNINTCIKFTIKNLGNEKFRLFCQLDRICVIAFYPRSDAKAAQKFKNISNKKDGLPLNSIIVKHSIENETLYIYTNPVMSFKERILDNKDKLIEEYSNDDEVIKNLEVRFIHNNEVLDELSQCFLNLGYTIK